MQGLSKALVRALLLSVLLLSASTALAHDRFPTTISLPDGWQPEGIAVGRGHTLYAGSLGTGAVYAADLRTGAGEVVVPPQQGRAAVGLKVDRRTNFIFVAGGPSGSAYVYDAATGADLGTFALATQQPSFVNDVVITRDAAYFTDSFRPVFYRLPLGPGGRLPAPNAAEEIPLSGAYTFDPAPGAFNANGIEATPDGRQLIIVGSSVGQLFLVDAKSGVASVIDLGGASVQSGDGILLRGRTLYVVRNFLNQVAVFELSNDFTSGTFVRTISDPAFDIPTTAALFGKSLYVVNARFTTPPTPSTTYTIVGVPARE